MSAQPDLVRAPDGGLLLSWVEKTEKLHRLRLTRSAGDAEMPNWQAPQTVAEGSDWFVNWADTPHIFALADGSLWAHWLRSTGPEPMDYGIELVRSSDGGKHWSLPHMVHPANGPGDHGFVTFWPQGRDALGMAWLDSRQKNHAAPHDDAGHHDEHGQSGAMILRGAVYGEGMRRIGEWPLDASTCDCCTTSSAITDRGVVVVYRGRGEGEIRDTRIVRFDGNTWTPPREVHADGWKMAGCPVNGPVVVARGNTVWVAWYTEAAGAPEIRAARSSDAGDSFGPPVSIAKGEQVLGRLGLALSPDALLLASFEQTPGQRQTLVLTRHALDWRLRDRIEVSQLQATGRVSGFPRVQWAGQAAWLVWTDVRDGKPGVFGASVY